MSIFYHRLNIGEIYGTKYVRWYLSAHGRLIGCSCVGAYVYVDKTDCFEVQAVSGSYISQSVVCVCVLYPSYTLVSGCVCDVQHGDSFALGIHVIMMIVLLREMNFSKYVDHFKYLGEFIQILCVRSQLQSPIVSLISLKLLSSK